MENTEEMSESPSTIIVENGSESVDMEKPKFGDGPNTISHFAKSLGFIPEAIERLLIEKKFQYTREEKLASSAFKIIKDNLEIISKNDKEIKVEMHKAFVASEKERKKREAKEKKERIKAEGKKPAKSKKAKKEEVVGEGEKVSGTI